MKVYKMDENGWKWMKVDESECKCDCASGCNGFQGVANKAFWYLRCYQHIQWIFLWSSSPCVILIFIPTLWHLCFFLGLLHIIFALNDFRPQQGNDLRLNLFKRNKIVTSLRFSECFRCSECFYIYIIHLQIYCLKEAILQKGGILSTTKNYRKKLR